LKQSVAVALEHWFIGISICFLPKVCSATGFQPGPVPYWLLLVACSWWFAKRPAMPWSAIWLFGSTCAVTSASGHSHQWLFNNRALTDILTFVSPLALFVYILRSRGHLTKTYLLGKTNDITVPYTETKASNEHSSRNLLAVCQMAVRIGLPVAIVVCVVVAFISAKNANRFNTREYLLKYLLILCGLPLTCSLGATFVWPGQWWSWKHPVKGTLSASIPFVFFFFLLIGNLIRQPVWETMLLGAASSGAALYCAFTLLNDTAGGCPQQGDK